MAGRDLDSDMVGSQDPNQMPDVEPELESELELEDGEAAQEDVTNLNVEEQELRRDLLTAETERAATAEEEEEDVVSPPQAQGDFTHRPTHNGEDIKDDDPDSLFVPEVPPIPPCSQLGRGKAAATPPSTPPPAPSETKTKSLAFKRLRKIHEKKIGERMAASRPVATTSNNASPGPEAFLDAIMNRPSSSTSMPVVNQDTEDKLAARKFLKLKRDYDELRRKQNGSLLFHQDVEWMRIKGTEEARKKKLARDLAKAVDDNQDEPDLFPALFPAPIDEEEDSTEDFTDDSTPRKRPRHSSERTPNSTIIADAELASMRVAIEAQADEPQTKKRKKGDAGGAESQASTPFGRAKGKSAAKAKTGPKKAASGKGSRNTAKKKKREVEQAVKQATSLFNSNVFQQQAGANARDLPTFKARDKTNALKELLASLPVDTDQKQARDDMNILRSATMNFDGKGSVRSDQSGNWMVKGMTTSLRNYQVLGSAFMRRRENALEEPRGGLMADQMGLGKTLMMLG